jgi:PAS domain S-box-containing protein
MRRTFDRSVLVGLGLLAALLIVSAALSWWNTHRLDEDASWVARTHEMLDLTSDVLLTVVDAETGERGFLITGKDEFLQPYNAAIQRLDSQMEALRDRTRNNPRQHERVERLEALIAVRLAFLKQGIDVRRRSAEAAQQFVVANKDKNQMDAVRHLVAEIEEEEHSLLLDRQRQSRYAYRTAVTMGLLSSALGLVMVGAFVWLLQRSLSAWQEAAASVQEQQEWLRTTLGSIGDAVIATDTEGQVTFLNSVAQTLTGWSQDEAIGQPLAPVFTIVDEQTHRPIENPASRVLREGNIVGLVNHTLLIAKGGTTYPIDDSAAPIRNADGSLAGAVLVFRDVTDQRQAEAALRESEQRERERAAELETVLRATPTAIWIAHDPDCRVITGNPAACRLLHVPEGVNVSATSPGPQRSPWGYRECQHGQPVPGPELPMQQAAARGVEIQGAELSFVFDSGEVRHIYGNAVPLRNPDGSVRGAIAAFMDITQLKQAEEALREADQRKDEFLATLSHELRNPLAPLRNALQIMQLAGENMDTFARVRDMMDRQLAQLVRLVDDLLDMSRITRGKLELVKERLEVKAFVERAVETSRPLIEAAQHELTFTLPAESLRVEGDPVRLTQVVSNLLNNSAKYTPVGGHIWLTVERQGGQAVIRVRDNGIGIPTDMLVKVFDMFTQVDRSLERSQGGLGIGLTLVRRLVEMHGGTVEAHSTGRGQGSEFVVYLPLAVDAVDGKGDNRKPGSASPATSVPARHILVVDDDRDTAESLAMLLRLMGNEVHIASDGPSALEATRALRPDLVLLDLGLPGMNGFEVAQQMRHMSELSGVVLVALTGWGQEENRRRSEEAGFNAHLVKPVEPAALQQLLATAKR